MTHAGQDAELLHSFAEGGQIRGFCDTRFERVYDAFVANFAERGEVGASLCLTHEGQTAVDLWGGFADRARARPWQRDTICLIFSSTKAATALCAHMLVSRGLLDLDAPITDYWPEFGSGGKAAARVSMALDHTAGVPVFRAKVEDISDWDGMAARIEAEEAFWEPGSRLGYHGLTFGWIVGELIRRVSGRSVGTFFREDVAEPLGLDFWIGLPEAEDARAAQSILYKAPAKAPASRFLQTALNEPDSLAALFAFNGGRADVNARKYRGAEIPAANGVTNGRGLAGLYAALALGGAVDGLRLVDDKTFARMRRISSATSLDAVLLMPTRFALGFKTSIDNRGLKTDPPTDSVILGEQAFGHVGMGGSVGFADPECGLGFGYVMNKSGPGILLNPRGQSLVDAAYESLGYRSNQSGAWRR